MTSHDARTWADEISSSWCCRIGLPSLVLFWVLPALLKRGVTFWPSLGVSVAAMLASYGVMVFSLGKFGIKLRP